MRQISFAMAFVLLSCMAVNSSAQPPGGSAGAAASAGRAPFGAAAQQRATVRVGGGATGRVAGDEQAGRGRAVGPNFGVSGEGRMSANGRAASLGRPATRELPRQSGPPAEVSGRINTRGHDAASADPTAPADRARAGRPREADERRLQAFRQVDLALARRLADIDRLRDVALANGDIGMLNRVDALEGEARHQHRHQIQRFEAVENSGGQAAFGLSVAERASFQGQALMGPTADPAPRNTFGFETSTQAQQLGGRAADDRSRPEGNRLPPADSDASAESGK